MSPHSVGFFAACFLLVSLAWAEESHLPIRHSDNPQLYHGFDPSNLTPQQKNFLALRMELIRRRRAEIHKASTDPSNRNAQLERSVQSEDLEGANTLGLGAAFPFLGLYGLGLGGLGVGLGPLAYAGFFG